MFLTFKQISVWSHKKIISAEKLPLVHQKIRDAISKSNAAYRVYRFKFIDNILSTLLISLPDDDKIIHHKLEIVNKRLSQTCTNQECRKIYHSSLKRKCVCGASVEKLWIKNQIKHPDESKTTSATLSSALKLVDGCDIGQIVSEQWPTVKMCEPILFNLNSYKNV